MAEINTDQIAILFARLNIQSRTLLDELTQLQQFILTRVEPNNLNSRPKLSLTKYMTDVQREAVLLDHHGKALHLDIPSHDHSQGRYPGGDDGTVTPFNKSLARVQNASTSTANSMHRIRSSNIGFLAAIWDIMKQSRGIIAVRKQIRYLPDTNTLGLVSSKENQSARERQKDALNRQNIGGTISLAKVPRRVKDADGTVRRADKDPVTVDIVADHGRCWIKIVTKSIGSLLMDLAKEGLVDLEESDTEQSESWTDAIRAESKIPNVKNKFDDLKLVKTAKEFLAAARTARVGIAHEHPQVYFYLTKVERGDSGDIDAVLQYIESMGVLVLSADQLNDRGSRPCAEEETTSHHQADLVALFDNMLAAPPLTPLTQTLNIDCTILIALISDISHCNPRDITIPVHYNGRQAGKDIEFQLQTEPLDPLLPSHIYPILCNKKLVCTSRAVAHLRNIVQIMGSPTETKRSNLFLPVGPQDDRKCAELRRELDQLSTHSLPESLQLPIEIVDDEAADNTSGETVVGAEAEVRRRLAAHPRLSPLNRSVIFYGWRHSMTTVSLNRDISDWLDRAIDVTLDEMDIENQALEAGSIVAKSFRGPAVLIRGRERSLLGSEKQ